MPLSANPCGVADDAPSLWAKHICLDPVSKDIRGELGLLDRDLQKCERPPCETLKTDHSLKVRVGSHQPCDSEHGRLLDGVLFIRRLVTAWSSPSPEARGIHTGDFTWTDGALGAFRIEGRMSGMTNVGTHREPAFDPCQKCQAPGFMEGRLCGRIVRAADKRLIDCQVVAAYRLRFDPSSGFGDSAVEGTMEGVVVCSCGTGRDCVEFQSFPAASHPNPWTVAGWELQVFDFSGAPTATVDVTAMGSAYTGVNSSFNTRINLAAAANLVDITLVHFAAPARVTALDGGGGVVAAATMTAAGVPETLSLNGAGIVTVVVEAPNNETLILEICTAN
jgi:hypothetical protein